MPKVRRCCNVHAKYEGYYGPKCVLADANYDDRAVWKINKSYCYIANAKTKRDWLIRGHVALDKCNVSLRETSKKLLPGYEYKKNKMAA